MCGIAALICPEGAPSLRWLEPMIGAIPHRGPDGSGIQTFESLANGWGLSRGQLGSVGLGHARLSIVDLSSAGHQPMSVCSGRYWITYNGEIYNYLEVRAELEMLGLRFVSTSDTEVLLQAYVQWGRACLQRFNGIFAFVIFDADTGTVFAARDRFGVKPLYYWRSPEGFLAVASEIKQFTVLPGWSAMLNGPRAYDFLNWNLYDHGVETLFHGVRQLRGGELFEATVAQLRHEAVRHESWYVLRPDPEAGGLGETEAVRQFAELFEDSIRLQLRADVPVGSCLSGGLDSSSVVCVARRLLDADGAVVRQHTFSARSAVEKYDEGKYIDQVVASTQVQAHEVTPPLSELFKLLPAIAWHQDEPFGSTSIYAQWHVFALAREHGVKVLLDGQGADEMLGGYHGFFGPRLSGLLRTGRWGALWREMQNLKALHGYPLSWGIARMADTLMPDVLRQALRSMSGRPSGGSSAWLDIGRLETVGTDPFMQFGARHGSVGELSLAQLVSTNLPMLLHCEDRNSMAHGIEARVPFLDHRLVEFSLGLNEAQKISEGVTKRVLRESMHGILPEPVRQRMDKLGFVTPEEVWIREGAPNFFREKLHDAVDASHGIIRRSIVTQFDDMLAGKKPFSHQWWRVISFGTWVEKFDVNLR